MNQYVVPTDEDGPIWEEHPGLATGALRGQAKPRRSPTTKKAQSITRRHKRKRVRFLA